MGSMRLVIIKKIHCRNLRETVNLKLERDFNRHHAWRVKVMKKDPFIRVKIEENFKKKTTVKVKICQTLKFFFFNMKMMAEVKRSLTDYNVGKCVFHEDIVDYVTRVLQNFLLYRMPENIRWTFFFYVYHEHAGSRQSWQPEGIFILISFLFSFLLLKFLP